MTRQIDTDAVNNGIRLKEQGSAPATPAAGFGNLYTTSAGLKYIDDNGVVFGPIGTGQLPGGRLTLTSGTPVTTADVTAAATLYYTPYHSNIITLYDGERWIPVVFTEKSLSLVGYTASKPYDIWGYLSSGTLALESTVWTDGTNRATALAYQDGRLVKNGATTRRYLGTIYINASGAQTDDALTARFVWNYYNRVVRKMYRAEATSHTYATNTIRAWNGSATIKMEFIIGVSEDAVLLELTNQQRTGSAGTPGVVGIGFDVVNASLSDMLEIRNANANNIRCGASFEHIPGIGYHYYHAVENSPGTATITLDAVYTDARILG